MFIYNSYIYNMYILYYIMYTYIWILFIYKSYTSTYINVHVYSLEVATVEKYSIYLFKLFTDVCYIFEAIKCFMNRIDRKTYQELSVIVVIFLETNAY